MSRATKRYPVVWKCAACEKTVWRTWERHPSHVMSKPEMCCLQGSFHHPVPKCNVCGKDLREGLCRHQGVED